MSDPDIQGRKGWRDASLFQRKKEEKLKSATIPFRIGIPAALIFLDPIKVVPSSGRRLLGSFAPSSPHHWESCDRRGTITANETVRRRRRVILRMQDHPRGNRNQQIRVPNARMNLGQRRLMRDGGPTQCNWTLLVRVGDVSEAEWIGENFSYLSDLAMSAYSRQ